jgi:uncharacterized membrane protein YqjE
VSPIEPVDDRSLGDLLKELTSELQHLVRAEVQLAKTELQDEARRAADAGKQLGVAAGAAVMALLLLSFAVAWGLAEVMAPGLAFLIVGAVYGIVAVVTFQQARQRLAHLHPVPEETVETLKEDLQWARTRSR